MKIPRQLPLKKIRENCLECAGNQYSMVRFCQVIDCPFWYLRFGNRPQTIIKRGGPEEKELLNRENFQEGAKYGPDKDLSSLQPKKRRRSSKNSASQEGVSHNPSIPQGAESIQSEKEETRSCR